MTIEQIKEMVNGSAYDFLRTNEHLGRKIIFLTLGGSYSYGTNVETSDVDVRGCALNSESDLLGLTSFEQVVNTQTDTTIYAFNKLVNLLLNCNPNTIESNRQISLRIKRPPSQRISNEMAVNIFIMV